MMLSKFQEWSEGGLWGYVVVVSAFMIQVFAFGTSQSIGVYNVEFLDYFQNSAAAISLVGSINVGIFLGAGPITGFLLNYLSHRQVALIGACISSVGLICLPFTPNVEYMYFFYGFLTGLGYCLLYVPSHVLCGLYFHRYRSLATGIATSGSGVGSTVLPYVIYMLIEEYGWKGSFYLLAGLNLHNFVFAALLRPPPKHLERDIAENTPEEAELLETKHKSLEMKHMKLETTLIHTQSENKHLIHLKKLDDVTPELSQSKTYLPYIVDEQETDTNNIHSAEDRVCKATFISKMKDQLRKVFTFGFSVYFINNIFWNMGASIVMLFGPEFNTNVGLDKEDAAIVFTLIGGGTCVGCILGGLLGNMKCCNRIALYVVANIATGTITLLYPLPFLHTFWGLLMLSLLWGLTFGVILGLLVVVTADLLGTEALGYGFGYLMLANGLGCNIAPPIAGWLMDVTGGLTPGFFLAGLVTIFGGILVSLIPLQHRLCPSKDSTAGNRVEIDLKKV